MRRGFTLTELLVGALIVGVVLAGCLQAFISLSSAFTGTSRMNATQTAASDVVEAIASEIRRAPVCSVTAGCGAANGAAFVTALDHEVTLNGKGPGETHRFWEKDGAIFRADGEKVLQIAEDARLDITYYRSTERTTGVLDAFKPKGADLDEIIGARVAVSVRQGDRSATYDTIVRVRNSPSVPHPEE